MADLTPPRLPRPAAWFLRLLRLGDRRAEVESDVTELYRERHDARGRFYAMRRLLVDILSLAIPRPSIGVLIQDVRHAFRLFRKHAGVVSVTVTGLGLAIAMCTTVFSILNAEVLRPFEMDDPSTVVKVQRLFEHGNSTSWPYSAFVGLQNGSTVASVQASLADTVRLDSAPGEPGTKPEPIAFVSGGYLAMLGGRAAAGRTLDVSDDQPGAAPVVVISHSFWKRHFGGDANVIGRVVRLSSGSATVVGVLRPKFTGPFENPPSLWAPFATYGHVYGGATISTNSQVQVNVIARTAPSVATSSAESMLSSVAVALAPSGSTGSDTAPQKTTGVRFSSGASRIDGPDAASVYLVIAVMFVVLGLVLALACTNVANLLLAGASSRTREFGVRVAMGASRQRLLRQLLSESLVIGLASGALGFMLSMWMVPTLTRMFGSPSAEPVTPDLNVLIFATVIALLSGLGAGLAPARYGARSDVSGVMKSQGLQTGASPKASRLRRGFIGFQAAASMLLLVTAALFLRAALHITHSELGFDANQLVTVGLDFPRSSADSAADADARIAAYLRTAVERVSAVPSVEHVALALSPPFGPVALTNLQRNGSTYVIVNNRTDAAYFKTGGFRIVRGRGYTPDEVAGQAPVALISESLARDFFPNTEPIGASLAPLTVDGSNKVTIIGVVADAMVTHVRGGGGTTYRPIGPDPYSTPQLVIRSTEPDHVIRDIEAALLAIDGRVHPTSTVVRESVTRFMNEPTLIAGLASAVAGLALVLSVLGIFGVTSFVVGQRAQEVSVRMAIGATSADVVWLLIRQNSGPVVIGLGVGLAMALAGSRVLIGALFGISPYDPIAVGSAVVVLASTAFAAVIVPARRAATANPANVLRT